MQQKQDAWRWQWANMEDREEWLWNDWIFPNRIKHFTGQTVLDCGCGGGQHISFVAPYAAHVMGVDLNAVSVAKTRTAPFSNVSLIDADLAIMNLEQLFDVVYCIGVIHHTDDPDATFKNLLHHCKAGGRMIVWCYSHEGNFLNRTLVEGAKKLFIHTLPRRSVWWLGQIITMLVYLPVYTVYLLPLRFLPYFEYFKNWRKLSFERNFINVFDKLNAPQTDFISHERVANWFNSDTFTDVHISAYAGVSWRASGTKR